MTPGDRAVLTDLETAAGIHGLRTGIGGEPLRIGIRTLAFPSGTVLLAGALATRSLAQCPTNTIDVCGAVTSTAPSYSASGCGPTSNGTGSYDLPAGTVSVLGNGDYPDGFASAHVTAEDVYHVVGPATPGLIGFSANLHAHGEGSSYYCTSASGSATLQFGTVKQSVTFHGSSCQGEGVDQTISLPQQHLVGEEFHLVMDVVATASAGASASMDGSLSFSGLPPGYSIVSCQGYMSVPTPSASVSWGRLKVRYR